jgi:hypothetical protein
VAGKLTGIESLLVSESVGILVSVHCSAQSNKEESTTHEQWCCTEVTSEQRTDLSGVSGYVLWDSVLIQVRIIYEDTALQQNAF